MKEKSKIIGWVKVLRLVVVLSILGHICIGKIENTDLFMCIRNLRNLGIVITNYSTDAKGHYPQNLQALIDNGYIDEVYIDPSSKEKYIYIVDGWDSSDFTLICPEGHKVFKGSYPYTQRPELILEVLDYFDIIKISGKAKPFYGPGIGVVAGEYWEIKWKN